MSDQDVCFSLLPAAEGHVGYILLNRPEVHNVLTEAMCTAIYKKLGEWAEDDDIVAVVVRGAGDKAFCAGGDVRRLYEIGLDDKAKTRSFFEAEYAMNHRIYCFPKLYIAFLDGITMGGGAGLSLHGSHPVATEYLRFAMPETTIGLFPDIGASDFLPRCPGAIGMYLGLTGIEINAADALALGLIDHVVDHDRIEDIVKMLCEVKLSVDPLETFDNVLENFYHDPGPSALLKQRDIIDSCFGQDSLAGIFECLRKSSEPWAGETLALLEKKSPISLHVTFNQLQHAFSLPNFSLRMQVEYRLAQSFAADADFYEGVRAALVDKDKTPSWQFRSIDEVSADQIDAYFAHKPSELNLVDHL